ncbi:MAG: hypothetical protein WCJ15_02910, partial [Alphaproteobacteria bacterium]
MEFYKSKNGHAPKSRVRSYALETTGLITLMVLAAAPLAAQPVGPTLVAGQAQVTSFGATTFVNQSTNNAIINWQDFSVSAGSAVQFNQPSSSSITLNRVTG